MALAETKIRRALKKAREALLGKGVIPTADRLKDALSRIDPLKPYLKLYRQGFRQPFRIAEHNRMLQEVEEDLKVLFDEFYGQAMGSLRLLDREDLLLRRVLHEAKRANDLLEYQLLTVKGATGYFFGAFDTFRDVSRVDLSRTTCEVDLGTESARLPRNLSSGVRLRMDHMLSVEDAPFEVLGEAVSSRTLPASPFSNCFDDLTTSWEQEIVTRSGAGVEGQVTFPLRGDRGAARFSAVYLDPLVRGVVDIQVFFSRDGLNYELLPIPRPVALDGGKVRVAGPSTEARFLRIRFRKRAQDRQEAGGESVYYLGLRSIEVHEEGFQTEADLVSLPLDPDDASLMKTIDKVSLTVDEELPPGTDIEYSIAPTNATQPFSRISPINREQGDLPVVLDFDRLKLVPAESNEVTVSSPTVHTFTGAQTKNGITFYDIHTLPETPNFGTVRVRRGLDAWRIVAREGLPETKTEADNYILFSADDNAQALYVNVEGEVIQDHPASTSGSPTRMRPRFPLLSEPSFRAFAAAGTHAQAPNYVIGRAFLIPGGLENDSPGQSPERQKKLYYDQTTARVYVSGEGQFRAGSKVLELATELKATFPLRRFVRQGVRLNYTYGSIAIDEVFEVLEAHDGVRQDGTKITLMVLNDPRDLLRDSGATISIAFQAQDVTEDVIAVEADGFLLDSQVEVLRSDRLVLDYRRPLSDDEALIPDSFEVRDSVSAGTVFLEGRDYSVDLATKTIYRDPAGSIRTSGPSGQISVRASFRYERRDRGLYVYETFVSVPGRDLVHLDLPGLTVSENERARIETGQGYQDLLSARRLTLEPGTHRVEVLSKPHFAGSGAVDTEAAIYKVINLNDGASEKIFSPRRYFERQEAFPAALEEVSLARLTNSVRKFDHRFFAVSGATVVLNWDPREPDDLLYLLPGGTPVLRKEKFQIGYSVLPASVTAISKIVLKAVLKRLPGSSAEVSPTLFSYHLRLSHA